ncbi:Uu.00g011530.m01.CDS01 [Anthostomella pinea]|uniref:Uu.00g011530.m01.CDS01 n=1 Tax=Anthostomella pinea TaxID=933095 RepID=A0AAI8VYG1_9PEZI|nr:Uu.00g011530.m01.CDS01 [Anthostomella pinea]
MTTTSPATDSKAPRACLLEIPAELRLQIYRHALDSSQLTCEVHPHASGSLDKKWRAPFWIHLPATYLALVQTCRLFRDEAWPLIDGIASWHLRGDRAVEHFVHYLSKTKRVKVTTLTGVETTTYQYMRFLNQFPRLRSVHVRRRAAFIGTLTPAQAGALPFETVIHAFNQDGLDYLGPQGIQHHIDQGRWDEFTAYSGIVFDYLKDTVNAEGFYESLGRFVLPCTLDLVRKTVVKHTDKLVPTQGGLTAFEVWSKRCTRPASAIAEAEHHKFEKDSSPLQVRYASYLGIDPTTVEGPKAPRRSKWQRQE